MANIGKFNNIDSFNKQNSNLNSVTQTNRNDTNIKLAKSEKLIATSKENINSNNLLLEVIKNIPVSSRNIYEQKIIDIKNKDDFILWLHEKFTAYSYKIYESGTSDKTKLLQVLSFPIHALTNIINTLNSEINNNGQYCKEIFNLAIPTIINLSIIASIMSNLTKIPLIDKNLITDNKKLFLTPLFTRTIDTFEDENISYAKLAGTMAKSLFIADFDSNLNNLKSPPENIFHDLQSIVYNGIQNNNQTIYLNDNLQQDKSTSIAEYIVNNLFIYIENSIQDPKTKAEFKNAKNEYFKNFTSFNSFINSLLLTESPSINDTTITNVEEDIPEYKMDPIATKTNEDEDKDIFYDVESQESYSSTIDEDKDIFYDVESEDEDIFYDAESEDEDIFYDAESEINDSKLHDDLESQEHSSLTIDEKPPISHIPIEINEETATTTSSYFNRWKISNITDVIKNKITQSFLVVKDKPLELYKIIRNHLSKSYVNIHSAIKKHPVTNFASSLLNLSASFAKIDIDTIQNFITASKTKMLTSGDELIKRVENMMKNSGFEIENLNKQDIINIILALTKNRFGVTANIDIKNTAFIIKYNKYSIRLSNIRAENITSNLKTKDNNNTTASTDKLTFTFEYLYHDETKKNDKMDITVEELKFSHEHNILSVIGELIKNKITDYLPSSRNEADKDNLTESKEDKKFATTKINAKNIKIEATEIGWFLEKKISKDTDINLSNVTVDLSKNNLTSTDSTKISAIASKVSIKNLKSELFTIQEGSLELDENLNGTIDIIIRSKYMGFISYFPRVFSYIAHKFEKFGDLISTKKKKTTNQQLKKTKKKDQYPDLHIKLDIIDGVIDLDTLIAKKMKKRKLNFLQRIITYVIIHSLRNMKIEHIEESNKLLTSISFFDTNIKQKQNTKDNFLKKTLKNVKFYLRSKKSFREHYNGRLISKNNSKGQISLHAIMRNYAYTSLKENNKKS